jgi:hypothetical protein
MRPLSPCWSGCTWCKPLTSLFFPRRQVSLFSGDWDRKSSLFGYGRGSHYSLSEALFRIYRIPETLLLLLLVRISEAPSPRDNRYDYIFCATPDSARPPLNKERPRGADNPMDIATFSLWDQYHEPIKIKIIRSRVLKGQNLI